MSCDCNNNVSGNYGWGYGQSYFPNPYHGWNHYPPARTWSEGLSATAPSTPSTPSTPVGVTGAGTGEDPNKKKSEGKCIPLPTEELGFTSSICVKFSVQNQTATLLMRVDGVGEVQLGQISKTQTKITADIGVLFPQLGKKGIGGTLSIVLNTVSMCLSACFNIDYAVGSVAPWYTMLTCMNTPNKPTTPANPPPQGYVKTPPSEIIVLSDVSPICGQNNRSSVNFAVPTSGAGGGYVVNLPPNVNSVQIWHDIGGGKDVLIGTFKNGQSLNLSAGNYNYYVAKPDVTKATNSGFIAAFTGPLNSAF